MTNISIVLSIYNEEVGLKYFIDELINEINKIQNYNFEIIFVNDGSKDKSQIIIEDFHNSTKHNNNYTTKTIEFSKNFGHEAAMIAGIDFSEGDAVICMDADGQHPPFIIIDLISQLPKYDIVLTNRIKRQDNSNFKNYLSKKFYNIINYLSEIKFSENSTDFFLVSREVAEVLKENYREKNRFLRGFIQSIGYEIHTVNFVAPSRKYGESNYNFKSLIKLALNAIFTFSNKPLRISIMFSIIFMLFSIVLIGYTLYNYFFGYLPPSGYTTIIIFLSISFSLLFMTLTINSIYFEKSLDEIRQRPLYIIKNKKS